MQTLFLTIKPKYARLILAGTKKYEYRTRFPKRPFKRIVFYATKPLMRVVGEAEILEVVSGTPKHVWDCTASEGGIDHEQFFDYFQDRHTAYAYRLTNVKKFDPPKKVSDYNLERPPRSYRYIDEENVF